MPRNLLKSFPTAMLRRGFAHVHPGSSAPIAPPTPPEVEPARLEWAPFDIAPEPPMTLLLIVPDVAAPAEPVFEDLATLAVAA